MTEQPDLGDQRLLIGREPCCHGGVLTDEPIKIGEAHTAAGVGEDIYCCRQHLPLYGADAMTPMSRTKFCVSCDRPIEGAAIKVAGESHLGASSGARGDDYRHVKGDPACRPRGR